MIKISTHILTSFTYLFLSISCFKQETKPAFVTKIISNTQITQDSTLNNHNTKGNKIPSQNITRSSYKNVIEIDDRNVIQSGSDYLFDISIPKKNETPVIFVSAQVPVELLGNLYPELSKLIVIIPNWSYYKELNQNLSPEIYCAEPMASSIIYELRRETGNLMKDSIVYDGFPEMTFAEVRKPAVKEVEIYYSEGFGSFCCPKDLQYENKPRREEFVASFEKTHHVKIENTYVKYVGKEGEKIYYYSLKGLTSKQKILFIQQRKHSRIINRNLKNIVRTPRIYTPWILKIEGNIEKI